MGANQFLTHFSNSIEVLSKDYGLPQLALNDDYRCKLNYNNDFDLEIVGNPQGCLQLHAYIISLHHLESPHLLFRQLLEMNAADTELSGCYLGIDIKNNAISFNSVMYMNEVDSLDLLAILHNFITKASEKKIKIQNDMFNSLDANGLVSSKRVENTAPLEPFHLLNKFV